MQTARTERVWAQVYPWKDGEPWLARYLFGVTPKTWYRGSRWHRDETSGSETRVAQRSYFAEQCRMPRGSQQSTRVPVSIRMPWVRLAPATSILRTRRLNDPEAHADKVPQTGD
jgi:hypothetical protein